MSFGDDNQRVEDAVCQAKNNMSQGVTTDDTERVTCPGCHHETMVTNTEQGDYCFYCRKEYPMARCTACHIFIAEKSTDEYGLCQVCSRQESMIVP